MRERNVAAVAVASASRIAWTSSALIFLGRKRRDLREEVGERDRRGHRKKKSSVSFAIQVIWRCAMPCSMNRLNPTGGVIRAISMTRMGLARYSVVNADLTINLLRRPLESPELRDMTRRFWVGTALTPPVFALEMGGHPFDIRHLIAQQRSNWVQLLLGTPVVLWAGWPFFVRALASVKYRSLNMFSLIALGTGAAWLYSIVGTVAPQWFPAAPRLADGAVAICFWAAAVITVLVLLGQVLELRAREKTSGAIKALLGLAPKTAVRVRADGSDETVPVDSIQVADLLRVRPVEKVTVDGELTVGCQRALRDRDLPALVRRPRTLARR
jgi:hypothetical protein